MTTLTKEPTADRHQTIHDDKMRSLDLVAAKFIPPEGGIQDEPTRCYKISKKWAKFLTGMVGWLADIPVWAQAQDEGYSAIDAFEQFLTGDDCMLYRLRQSPSDPCVLQESIDGGANWSDVFDFSACVSIQDKSYQVSIQNEVTRNEQTFVDIYNDYTTNYNGLPSDVHPNLAPPAGDDSALRAALCNALYELIRKACDSAVSFYTESVNQTQAELNFLLAIAGFTFTALALAAAVPTAGASLVALGGSATLIAAGVGLGAGLANYLVDFWQQHTIDQFQDTAAMEDVTCYLFDCLEPTDVSLDDFRTCLAGTITGTNQQAILDYLEILMSHDSTYAAFLEKWSNNEEFARAGIELYCPCLSGFQVYAWEFSNGMGLFEFDDFFGGGVSGEWANGRVQGTGSNDSKTFSIAWNNFNPAWRVRGVKIYLERVNGDTAQGNNDSAVQLRPTPDSQVGSTQLVGGQNQVDGLFEKCQTLTVPAYVDGTNQLYIFSRITKTAANPPVQVYLHKIDIVFIEDFAKGGYVTDDGDICT